MNMSLSSRERTVLAALDELDSQTRPGYPWHPAEHILMMIKEANWAAQGLTRTMAALIRKDLARKRVLPKKVYYQITDAGKEARSR